MNIENIILYRIRYNSQINPKCTYTKGLFSTFEKAESFLPKKTIIFIGEEVLGNFIVEAFRWKHVFLPDSIDRTIYFEE